MRLNLRWSCLAVLAITLLICQESRAGSLVGKVIEINDGDEITIFNLNRPVRIKLIGIDAPEKDQVFGPTAKQHLSDLVYDKVVFVEYSGIGAHTSLIGRVLLNDTDIGAQMIRDGAAWFDKNYQGRMSDEQREVYTQSEQAARNERRGLWQTEGAIAPWEFVKARESKREPVTSSPGVSPTQLPKVDRPIPELTNLNLLRTGSAVAKPQAALADDMSDMSWATEGPYRKTWRRYQPAGENFTVLLPEGKRVVKSIPVGDQTFEVNYYLARDGETMYEMIWFSAPHFAETDSATIDSALASFLHGVVAGFQQTSGGDFRCEPSAQRKLAIAGYDGREVDLSDCTVPGAGRIFTKVVGEKRQLYAGFTFYKQPDDNVSRFLKSFTVISRKNESQKTTTQ
jgi:endonuclease YncB( thermonuclease family)